MKIILEQTDKIVELQLHGTDAAVPARVWQGVTESGIPVQAFITRIAPEIPKSDRQIDELTREFEDQLRRTADPRESVAAIPMRLII